MNTLQQLSQSDAQWSLDEFVELVNRLLPRYLPDSARGSRGQADLNPRLVRHYTSQGLVDKSVKAGKEARYTYRHLLQLLVVRRMMAEGYTAAAIDRFAIQQSNRELEALLEGGVQLTAEVANPALSFLQSLQQEEQSQPSPPAKLRSASSAPQPLAKSQWTRLSVLPGLEIHVREDFQVPRTQQERESLLKAIRHHLFTQFKK
ncbi:MAG: MerR family transcriptional regulator [Synechococcus sp.]